MLYIISSTHNTVLFGPAPLKTYQNHHLDPINGRIRTFQTRIRIGKKTRIHPDPTYWDKGLGMKGEEGGRNGDV